jgi:hypothetical protein
MATATPAGGPAPVTPAGSVIFWTKDTGIAYLPGLLAASLGYNGS